MSRYRAALIDTGKSAGSHVRALQELKDQVGVVAAVAVIQERVEEFSKKNALPNCSTDATQVLEKERPALVHRALLPQRHDDLIIPSLQAGAWGGGEKALGMSLAAFEALAGVEQQTESYGSRVFEGRCGSRGQHGRGLMEGEAGGRR
jgi:predicted dehydrogenase